MSEYEEEIERINHNLRQIRKELNDMSHAVVRIEEDIMWIKTIVTWVIGLVSALIGLSLWSILLL